MTESNSVELFNVEFVLTEKLTLKVEIPLFGGFVHPSDFPKSGGDPVYISLAPKLIFGEKTKLSSKRVSL